MTKCENCYHKKVCINGANYKNAENCKQYKPESLIVELPCRVGDVLYRVYDDDCDGYIEKVKCCSIEIDNFFGISIYCKTIEGSYDTYVPDDFGEYIFLTREEAERALEEREKNG